MLSENINIDGKPHILSFYRKGATIFTSINDNTVALESGVYIQDTHYDLLLLDNTPKKTYAIDGTDILLITNDEVATIKLNSLAKGVRIALKKEKNQFILFSHPQVKIYVNNIAITEDTTIHHGDVVDIQGVEFIFRQSTLEIIDHVNEIDMIKLIQVEDEISLRNATNKYKRSPRIIYNEPKDDITIASPSAKQKASAQSLLQVVIPPLLMVSVTVAMGVLMKRGPYVYMAIASSGVAICMSTYNYFKQKKERKEKNRVRQEVYMAYLVSKLEQLRQKANEQAHALTYHYPDNDKIVEMLLANSSRMYEKTTLHHDFLVVRKGTGQLRRLV